MFSEEQKQRLRQATERALEKAKQRERIVAGRTGPPRPGDLYVFPDPATEGLDWAVVSTHPDDEHLLYVVAADDHPLVGSPDVAIPQEELIGPLVLRCGCGLWLHQDAFAEGRRMGVIPAEYLKRARYVLSRMVTADWESTDEQVEVDADPEYEDWIAHVSGAADQLRERLDLPASARRDAAQMIRIAADAFRRQTLPRPTAPGRNSEHLPLAAASGDWANDIERIVDSPVQDPLLAPVDAAVAGTLLIQRDGAEYSLLYVPSRGESPPEVNELVAPDTWNEVEWKVSPAGTMCRALLRGTLPGAEVIFRLPEGTAVVVERTHP